MRSSVNSIIESLFGDVDGSAAKADLDRHMDALKAEFVAKKSYRALANRHAAEYAGRRA